MKWSLRKALGLEQRLIQEIPGIERPNPDFLTLFGIGDVKLPVVTLEAALRVPAVLAAVAFLSRTLAALPKHAYRKGSDGASRIEGGLETLIHEAPNPEWTAFKLWQHFWQQVFTGGRGLVYIERSGSNIVGLWPIDPTKAKITRSPLGATTYEVGSKVYQASEIIDVPFMLRADGICHYSPLNMGQKAIQLALAMNDYGSGFFAGGGVPPLAMKGPLPQGPDAFKRAMDQVSRAIDLARSSDKPIFGLPPEHELTPVGLDPERGQMTDARRFQVEEIARVYQIPPAFLQDLTNGTFSNTEQQDLFFVKHLVGQWVEALDQEMNLKLFGQRNGGRYIEHNVDGLLRGDFASRMAGHAQAIQNAIRTPNEARELENLPALPNGDELLIQGATVPLGTQPQDTGTPPPDNGGTNIDGTP